MNIVGIKVKWKKLHLQNKIRGASEMNLGEETHFKRRSFRQTSNEKLHLQNKFRGPSEMNFRERKPVEKGNH